MRVPEEFEMDNGGTVTIQPVPPRLYGALVARYEKGRPRPKPPTIEVKFKGEEPVMQENPHDPDYERQKTEWHSGLDDYLFAWFMDHAVDIRAPDGWDGGLLPLAGVKVPRSRPSLERLAWLPLLGRWLRSRRTRRGRLWYDYYATKDDVHRMAQAMLSAAGLYSEEMLGQAEDTFPDHDRRGTAEGVGDAQERGPRVIDLHRTAGHGSARLQSGTVGGTEGLGQGEAGSFPEGEGQSGGGRGREGGAQGQGQVEAVNTA